MISKNKFFKTTLIASCSILMFNTMLFTNTDVKAAEINNSTYLSSAKKVKNNLTYSVTGKPKVGNTIEMNINLSNVSNLYGASLDFVYDNSLLEIESINQGSLFNGRIDKPLIKAITPNQVSLTLALKRNSKPIEGNGSIATIKAKVLKAGTIKLKTTDNYSNLSLAGATTCIKLSTSNSSKIDYKSKNKTIKLTNSTKKK